MPDPEWYRIMLLVLDPKYRSWLTAPLHVQLRVPLVETLVAPFAGEGDDGVPSVVPEAAVVKLQVELCFELLELSYTTTFQ